MHQLWLYKLHAQNCGSVVISTIDADCSVLPKVLETTSLEEAQAIMAKHQLQSLPLVDQDGKLV